MCHGPKSFEKSYSFGSVVAKTSVHPSRRIARELGASEAGGGVSRKSVSIAENCPILGQPASICEAPPLSVSVSPVARRYNIYDASDGNESYTTRFSRVMMQTGPRAARPHARLLRKALIKRGESLGDVFRPGAKFFARFFHTSRSHFPEYCKRPL